MCGICGIYNYRKTDKINTVLMHMMTDVLEHRGPDDQGFHIDEYIGLGHRRLSIIDIAGGHQPMANENNTIWVVFNGEIYNFIELRKELISRGHKFRTQSDTEVIVHLYEEMGEDFLNRLNGIFAIGLWDKLKKKLILARDHFGVKPLYYYYDTNRLIFASEIKALLKDATIRRELDTEALDYYLVYRFVPSPFTLLKGIRKIAPGHKLICDKNGIKVVRYWKSVPIIEEKIKENDWIAGLQDKLYNAVRRQMVADVPLGMLLSGGVDSSVVLAIMSELVSGPLKSFTVGFTEGESDDICRAREVAHIFATEHHEIIISHDEYADFIPKSLWFLEEPSATSSAIAMYYVCKLAREHVKVVLTGQGADEPFAGYTRYKGERYSYLYRNIPVSLRNLLVRPMINRLPRNERLKRAVNSLDIADDVRRFVNIYTVFSDDMRERLYNKNMLEASNYSSTCVPIEYWQNEVRHLDPLTQMLYIDTRFSLPDDFLMYGDKMSMATSVEARVPFLDRELMNFVESMPSNLKLKGFTGKYIHKKAVAKWLPQNIINRKKVGFEAPVDKWFQSELNGYVKDILFSEGSACREYFSIDYVKELLDKHSKGRENFYRQLFSLLSFEIWYQLFIKNSSI